MVTCRIVLPASRRRIARNWLRVNISESKFFDQRSQSSQEEIKVAAHSHEKKSIGF